MTNKETVGDKHSGGLTCEAFGNKQTHCKLLRDNLVTGCKLLRDTGNKQAHCMHIVRFTLVTRKPLDESNQGVTCCMGLHFRVHDFQLQLG